MSHEDDDQTMTDIGGTPTFESGDQAKDAFPKTTLQDLPFEMHEHILMETIISEIRDRKLLRDGWKRTADRAAEQLRNVCPQWNHVLTTDVFRSRLQGMLDGFPHVEYCFETVAEQKFQNCVTAAALNDQVFVLSMSPQSPPHAVIKCYDQDNLKRAKRTLQLPDVTNPWNMVACSVVNCLYILHQTVTSIDIWRIMVDDGEFKITRWIKCLDKLVSIMSIAVDGSLVLYQGPVPPTIKVYNPDGSLQHQMELANQISCLHDVVPKSNGNFVLVKRKVLTEVDRHGNTVREYSIKYSVHGAYLYCAVDPYDRIVAVDSEGHVSLLDSEFNSVDGKLELDLLQKRGYKLLYRIQYNRKRNEFVAIQIAPYFGAGSEQGVTIFRFTEKIST